MSAQSVSGYTGKRLDTAADGIDSEIRNIHRQEGGRRAGSPFIYSSATVSQVVSTSVSVMLVVGRFFFYFPVATTTKSLALTDGFK